MEEGCIAIRMHVDSTYIKMGGVDSFNTSIAPLVEVVLVPLRDGCPCTSTSIEEKVSVTTFHIL